MNIVITGKELKATEAIKEYVEKKLERIERYFEGAEIDVSVKIKTERAYQIAEMQVNVKGYSIRAVTETKDLYASIDLAIDRVARQLRKDKEKKLDKDQRINKVERTMATQSLNVRVTAKLDLIQKKYPINPKDHPELLNKKKIEKERKENVKLVVENKKAGFATTAVIISIIALICGIGFGIAYVLVTLGG